MHLKTFLAVHLGVGVAIGAAAALAAQIHTVSQADLNFSVSEMTAAAGDSIDFVNDDRTAHNVLVNDAALRVNSGALRPGDTYTLELPEGLAAGNYTVMCAIHPRMKIELTIQ